MVTNQKLFGIVHRPYCIAGLGQNQCNTSPAGVVCVHSDTKQTTIERVSTLEIVPRPSITIIGGGPGGYEAALVASKFGANVTLVERNGIGGSAVLTDVVPSKTLIAAADSRSEERRVGKECRSGWAE